MKKPTPKSSPQKKSKTDNVWSEKTAGKAMDFGKAGMSTIGDLADWGKEVQRTKQEYIKAQTQIAGAKEVTAQTRLRAEVDIMSIHRDHHKDKMEHERELQRLKNQRENDAALIHQRDRVLDKLLDNPEDNTPQLADSLRALLPNGEQP